MDEACGTEREGVCGGAKDQENVCGPEEVRSTNKKVERLRQREHEGSGSEWGGCARKSNERG